MKLHAIGLALASAALALPAASQSEPPANTDALLAKIEAQCPEAMHEVEARSRLAQRPALGPPTRPALRENLLLMAKQDQEARAGLTVESFGDPTSPQIVRMQQVDGPNLRRLKHIVNQDGFPTARMVGLDGVKAAWLLMLHAVDEADFQERVLQLTKGHVRRGEVSADDVAMLTDDLLVSRGKPQRYGSNFELRDGQWLPSTMEDEANVEVRRRAAGLGTLANYACVMRVMYSAQPAEPK